MIPCSYWASTCLAALPSCMTLYEISVRQTRDLPVVSLFPHPASFRFHLTMDTLAFGYILPTTGWIRDFNPLETCAAGRTRKKPIPSSMNPFWNSILLYLLLPLSKNFGEMAKDLKIRLYLWHDIFCQVNKPLPSIFRSSNEIWKSVFIYDKLLPIFRVKLTL